MIEWPRPARRGRSACIGVRANGVGGEQVLVLAGVVAVAAECVTARILDGVLCLCKHGQGTNWQKRAAGEEGTAQRAASGCQEHLRLCSPARKCTEHRPSMPPKTKPTASLKTPTDRVCIRSGDSSTRSGAGNVRTLKHSTQELMYLHAPSVADRTCPSPTTIKSPAASIAYAFSRRAHTATHVGVRGSNTRSALSYPDDTIAPISGRTATLRTPASCCEKMTRHPHHDRDNGKCKTWHQLRHGQGATRCSPLQGA